MVDWFQYARLKLFPKTILANDFEFDYLTAVIISSAIDFDTRISSNELVRLGEHYRGHEVHISCTVASNEHFEIEFISNDNRPFGILLE